VVLAYDSRLYRDTCDILLQWCVVIEENNEFTLALDLDQNLL
jgi:hypothetical protein